MWQRQWIVGRRIWRISLQRMQIWKLRFQKPGRIVQTAKEHMETIKTAMEETESGGIDLTNESDEENMAEKTEPAATIKEGMQSMAMNLEALSKKAEEMVQESAPKRPRTADPGEHFAQPGK